MKSGKITCNFLKDLRRRIVVANEIPFETDECTHKGDCPGTCPKCEEELAYILKALEERDLSGLPIKLDGLMTEEELDVAFNACKPVKKKRKDEEIHLLGDIGPIR